MCWTSDLHWIPYPLASERCNLIISTFSYHLTFCTFGLLYNDLNNLLAVRCRGISKLKLSCRRKVTAQASNVGVGSGGYEDGEENDNRRIFANTPQSDSPSKMWVMFVGYFLHIESWTWMDIVASVGKYMVLSSVESLFIHLWFVAVSTAASQQ